MCKIPSILLLVATLFVLVAGNCIYDILVRESKGKTLLGGYQRVKDPENNAVIRKIVADSVEDFNFLRFDNKLYKENDHFVAYKQV